MESASSRLQQSVDMERAAVVLRDHDYFCSPPLSEETSRRVAPPLECAGPALPPSEGTAMAAGVAAMDDAPDPTYPSGGPNPAPYKPYDTVSCSSRAPSTEETGQTPPDASERDMHTNLTNALPDIIRWAANLCGLPVPEGTTQASSSLLGGRFAAKARNQVQVIWPLVPDIQSLLLAEAGEPLKLRAPVSSFVPVTKVQGLTDKVFPPVPPLEPSLSAVFGLNPAKHVRKPLSPSSPGDQFAMKLQDRIHRCSAQIGAVANNIALLASGVRRQPTHEKAGAALDVITNLCMVLATCSARISAWATLLQRQVWLRLSSIPNEVKRQLLEGPISSQGLFGPHYQAVFDQLRASSEALELVKKYAVSPRADPCAARRPVRPREQSRAFRSLQRRSSPSRTFTMPQNPVPSRGHQFQYSQRGARSVRGKGRQQPPWAAQYQSARRDRIK